MAIDNTEAEVFKRWKANNKDLAEHIDDHKLYEVASKTTGFAAIRVNLAFERLGKAIILSAEDAARSVRRAFSSSNKKL